MAVPLSVHAWTRQGGRAAKEGRALEAALGSWRWPLLPSGYDVLSVGTDRLDKMTYREFKEM